MKSGSLFTGIGGFDLACENVGIETIWQAEKDKNCLELLEKRFPNARRYSDVREITKECETVDIITGGFPCQDLSVAGKRAGLAGERSGLWFEFARIIDELEPKWVVVENVPGLLSSNKGEDFAIIIRWLAERGYGVAWRILDAQYFGVAQRRRRVFIVGSLGNGRSAEVLFERESSPGDTAPSRETGEGTSTYAVRRAQTSSNGWGIDEERVHTLDNTGGDAVAFNHQSGGDFRPQVNFDRANTLQVNQGQAVAFQQNTRDEVRLMNGDGKITGALASQPGMKQQNYLAQRTVGALQARDGKGIGTTIDDKVVLDERHVSPTLEAEYFRKRYSNQQFFSQNGDGFPVTAMGVRRLTPLECERLQGFPDGWTDDFSDSARYRMLGNAVAVPVVKWILERIANV